MPARPQYAKGSPRPAARRARKTRRKQFVEGPASRLKRNSVPLLRYSIPV
jgi:hypothetical protein